MTVFEISFKARLKINSKITIHKIAPAIMKEMSLIACSADTTIKNCAERTCTLAPALDKRISITTKCADARRRKCITVRIRIIAPPLYKLVPSTAKRTAVCSKYQAVSIWRPTPAIKQLISIITNNADTVKKCLTVLVNTIGALNIEEKRNNDNESSSTH